MNWQESMKREAVAIAFPDWIHSPADVITLDVEFDDGYDPTYGGYDPRAHIEVSVKGNDGRPWFKTYRNDEINDFWTALMRGDGRNWGF